MKILKVRNVKTPTRGTDKSAGLDFYVPEDELAVQVSFSMAQSPDTFNREVNALKKLPTILPCRRRLILTNDETGQVEDEYGTIEIMPVWKWLL